MSPEALWVCDSAPKWPWCLCDTYRREVEEQVLGKVDGDCSCWHHSCSAPWVRALMLFFCCSHTHLDWFWHLYCGVQFPFCLILFEEYTVYSNLQSCLCAQGHVRVYYLLELSERVTICASVWESQMDVIMPDFFFIDVIY